MRIAFVCSAHGFGHLTRELALVRALPGGAKATVFTAAPATVVELFAPGTEVVPARIDVGLVQTDSVSIDREATLQALDEANQESQIDRWAEQLRGFDGVVADCPPLALEAARRSGTPALALGNFDWAWIYQRMGLEDWAERFEGWQTPHPAGSLTPGPGMHGFAATTELGILGRRSPPVRVADRGVLVSFGGFGLARLNELLPTIPGVTWVTAPPLPDLGRPDSLHVTGVAYPSLVAGAAAVLTKPGYGIATECALAGTPIVWVRRPGWPEAASIEAFFAARGDLPIQDNSLAETLAERWGRPRPEPVEDDGAHRIAQWVVAELDAQR